MAKSIDDTVLDGALDVICTATEITVCSAQPTTYAEAHTTYMLAAHTMTPTDGQGDFTISNGDSSGRKVAVTQQADITITNSGTATHVALTITGSSKLLLVTTCTSQSLTSGNTVTIPTFDDEIADPT